MPGKPRTFLERQLIFFMAATGPGHGTSIPRARPTSVAKLAFLCETCAHSCRLAQHHECTYTYFSNGDANSAAACTNMHILRKPAHISQARRPCFHEPGWGPSVAHILLVNLMIPRRKCKHTARGGLPLLSAAGMHSTQYTCVFTWNLSPATCNVATTSRIS